MVPDICVEFTLSEKGLICERDWFVSYDESLYVYAKKLNPVEVAMLFMQNEIIREDIDKLREIYEFTDEAILTAKIK